jgi:hypothetical protein
MKSNRRISYSGHLCLASRTLERKGVNSAWFFQLRSIRGKMNESAFCWRANFVWIFKRALPRKCWYKTDCTRLDLKWLLYSLISRLEEEHVWLLSCIIELRWKEKSENRRNFTLQLEIVDSGLEFIFLQNSLLLFHNLLPFLSVVSKMFVTSSRLVHSKARSEKTGFWYSSSARTATQTTWTAATECKIIFTYFYSRSVIANFGCFNNDRSHFRWRDGYGFCHWTQGSLVQTRPRTIDF